jgi:hypothetical protein
MMRQDLAGVVAFSIGLVLILLAEWWTRRGS